MSEWEELILSHIKNMLFYLVFLNVNIYIFNTTIVMIDDKKIEEEATNYAQDGYNNYDDNIQRIIEEAFKSGATWMQEKFLKKGVSDERA